MKKLITVVAFALALALCANFVLADNYDEWMRPKTHDYDHFYDEDGYDKSSVVIYNKNGKISGYDFSFIERRGRFSIIPLNTGNWSGYGWEFENEVIEEFEKATGFVVCDRRVQSSKGRTNGPKILSVYYFYSIYVMHCDEE